MEQILNYITDLELIHPILPVFANISLIIMICLIIYIPISLFAWIIEVAFRNFVNLLVKNLRQFSEFLTSKILEFKKNIHEIMQGFYSGYNSYVNYDSVDLKFSGHPLQKSLDDFEKTLIEAPNIAFKQEEEKKSLIQQLNENLKNLAGGVESFKDMYIPELELDKEHVVEKKGALSTLLIFVPLLISVIIVNTVLLNTFFGELLDQEIFGIPYSIPISLMFTFIEAGVGIMFGFMDRNRDENVANSSKYISLTLGWIIILLLAGIELVLYFLVGCLYNETYDGDLEALVEEAMSGNIIEPFLNGGFLSFLGPIIVFALYLFGHQVSVAYFKYSRRTDLDRFKDDLDSKFKMYEAIKSGMSSASEGIKDILGKIKDANLNFKRNKEDPSKMLTEFGNKINAHKKDISSAIKNVEKIKIPQPEVSVMKLSEKETQSFLRSNNIYLFLLIFSMIVLSALMPTQIDYGKNTIEFFGLNVLLGLIFSGFSIILGILNMGKVDVGLTQDGKVARLVIEKSMLFKTFSILLFIILLAASFITLNPSLNLTSIVLMLISGLCLTACFYSGRKLTLAINTWYITIQILWINIKIIFCYILDTITKILSKVIELLLPLIESLAFPIKFLFRKKTT